MPSYWPVKAIFFPSGENRANISYPFSSLVICRARPPAPPTSLAAIAASGAINLIWDPNTEPDLAGYVVLRAEAPGDTLQPITKEPIATTTFRDDSVRPGVRYVYAVVAVDRASPANTSAPSNRVEETARQ